MNYIDKFFEKYIDKFDREYVLKYPHLSEKFKEKYCHKSMINHHYYESAYTSTDYGLWLYEQDFFELNCNDDIAEKRIDKYTNWSMMSGNLPLDDMHIQNIYDIFLQNLLDMH